MVDFPRFRIAALLALAVAALALTGCQQFRMGMMDKRAANREDRERRFSSPIAPVQQRNMGLPQILDTLQKRHANVRSVNARLDLVAGAGSGRKAFDANLAVRPGSLLRVRGTQNQISVFDILVRDQQVRFVSFPDRVFFDGSLADLRANPDLLAGLYPEQLIENFTVEQSLVRRLRGGAQPLLYSDRDHYIVRFDAGGVSERYHLRRADLLVDRYETVAGNRTLASVRYWAYEMVDGRHLLPTQFVVESSDARFSATVREMRINDAVNPALSQLDVPPGFRRVGARGN